jgi:hypothetical protein
MKLWPCDHEIRAARPISLRASASVDPVAHSSRCTRRAAMRSSSVRCCSVMRMSSTSRMNVRITDARKSSSSSGKWKKYSRPYVSG